MRHEIRNITFVTLVGALLTSFGITLVSMPDWRIADAVECQHEGNHYSAKNATKTASGIKEYWVCCKCHEHFLEQVSGNWINAGIANIIIDANDNRYIPKTNEVDEQGFTYSADGKTITSYTPVSGVTEVVIPEGVTDIGDVFEGNKTITSIVIPGSVSTIEESAFKNCDNLKHVTISNGTTTLSSGNGLFIKNGVFQYCDSLEWVVIPESVTYMGGYTFGEANSKLKIYCEISSKPSGWSSDWNKMSLFGGKFTTYWGLGKGWHYASDGVTPIAN